MIKAEGALQLQHAFADLTLGGDAASANARFSTALQLLDETTRRVPDRADLQDLVGRMRIEQAEAQSQLGFVKDAVTTLQTAIDGQSHILENKLGEGFDRMETECRFTRAFGRVRLAKLLLDSNRFDEALAAVEKGLKELDDVEKAIDGRKVKRQGEQIIDRDMVLIGRLNALQVRGALALRKRKIDDAIRDLGVAIDLLDKESLTSFPRANVDSIAAAALNERALAYAAKGDLIAAKKDMLAAFTRLESLRDLFKETPAYAIQASEIHLSAASTLSSDGGFAAECIDKAEHILDVMPESSALAKRIGELRKRCAELKKTSTKSHTVGPDRLDCQ